MQRLLVIAQEALAQRLAAELRRAGFNVSTLTPGADAGHASADLALVEFGEGSDGTEALVRHLRLMRHVAVILLLPKASLSGEPVSLPGDDFIVEPYDLPELRLRITRLLAESATNAQQVKAGDLVIDPAQAEVYVNGQPVELTFREYELLRFLVENQGRVLSREALLNAVWGYDYFGGDRTVDVHVTRLRGKLEDAEHSFIETVRNMGYRFKKQG